MVQPLWKTVWQFFKKLKTELPYDTITNPTSGYTSKRIHHRVSKRFLHIQVHRTFHRAKRLKATPVSGCINKTWYIRTKEYYVALKRKEILLHATT